MRTSEVLAAFRQDDEPLHLRGFGPRNAPKTTENRPLMLDTTLTELKSSRDLQHQLKEANKNLGIYFAPNVGGSTDESIIRFTAFFVENDKLTIEEQHAILDSAPLQPSIRIVTRKSVHAFWLIDGPCSREAWVNIQERLIAYFDGDPKIKNPSRVMRLPGFDHIHINGHGPERKPVTVHTFEPHRKYTAEQMQQTFPAPSFETTSQPQPSGTFEYHEDRHAELVQRLMSRGKRNSKGNWDARGICHSGSGDKGVVYFPQSGAVTCNAEPKCDYFSILRSEGLPDGHLPSEESANRSKPEKSKPEVTNDPALRFVRMADVEAKEVEWLWEPYIAIGALTILEGPPGVGKSTVMCAVASAVSNGKGAMGITFPIGKVLLCSAEDAKAYVLRPRLDRSGADIEKIFALDEPLTLDQAGRMKLEAAVIEYQPLMVLFDPFFAYTGGKVDIHRANEMRDITAWLTGLAEKYRCAIVAIRHLSKSRGMGRAIDAGLGSIDLSAAARSVVLVGQDPDDLKKCAMIQIKNNLGPIGVAVGYTIEGGVFYWTGESDLTAARILAPGPDTEERSAIGEAIEFLREALAHCDRETSEVTNEARRLGIAEKTLRRAREKLKIKARREGLPGTKQKFFWSLPEEPVPQNADSSVQDLPDEIYIPAHATDEDVEAMLS